MTYKDVLRKVAAVNKVKMVDGLDRNKNNWIKVGKGRFKHRLTGQDYFSEADVPPDMSVKVNSKRAV